MVDSQNKKIKVDKINTISYHERKITDDYILGKPIGKGGFGKVLEVVHKKTKQIRAVKIIDKKKEDFANVLSEIDILSKLSHPNIVQIYETYEDANTFYIVTEFCEGGPLIDKLKEKGHFSEKEVFVIIRQLLSSIRYSHQNHIVHCDIKPDNILIDDKKDDSEPIIKLIDWGSASFFSKNKKLRKVKGTKYYVAPEVIKKYYDEKCDIWSIGITMYTLLCGYTPFNYDIDDQIYSNTLKLEFPKESWSNISNEAKDLIVKMLIFDSKRRISASDAMNHPWFLKNLSVSPKENYPLEKSSLDNMKNFKEGRQFEKASIIFIVYQLIFKENKKNLIKLFQDFDTNGDGVISKEEFVKKYKKMYGEIDEKDINKIIDNVDMNGDGVINWDEFLASTISKDLIMSNDNLKNAFDTFDKDKSGSLSIEEIREIFKKNNKNLDISLLKKILMDNNIENKEIKFEKFKEIISNFFK